MPRIRIGRRRAAQRQRESSQSGSFRRSSFYSIDAAAAPFGASIPCTRGFLFHLHARYRFAEAVIRGSSKLTGPREGSVIVAGWNEKGAAVEGWTGEFAFLHSGTNSADARAFLCVRRSHAPRNSRKRPRDRNIHSRGRETVSGARNYLILRASFL